MTEPRALPFADAITISPREGKGIHVFGPAAKEVANRLARLLQPLTTARITVEHYPPVPLKDPAFRIVITNADRARRLKSRPTIYAVSLRSIFYRSGNGKKYRLNVPAVRETE